MRNKLIAEHIDDTFIAEWTNLRAKAVLGGITILIVATIISIIC